jgi:hypothetical protein
LIGAGGVEKRNQKHDVNFKMKTMRSSLFFH